MSAKSIVVVLAAIAMMAKAAVVIPQQYPSSISPYFSYVAPQSGFPVAFRRNEPSFITPAVTMVDGQQQSQPGFFKTGPSEAFTGRVMLDNVNALLNSPVFPNAELNTVFQTLKNLRPGGVLAKADLYRSGDTATAATYAGSVLFFQKSASNNVDLYLDVLSTGTGFTAISTTAGVWSPVQVLSGPAIGTTAGALCDPTVLGTEFVTGGLAVPNVAPRTGTNAAGSTVNSIIGTASYLPTSTITLFGTNSLINKVVRIAPNTATGNVAESYCGVIRVLQ